MAELPTALVAALQDRYRLQRELGRGGMAVVYLAEDLRHERPVALKVLLREVAAALGPERFQREIKLAARLQHPHILGVHDSGEAAGRLWFTMPFVEGESLRDRLRREGQLGLDDALRIGREAAAALDYAHRHGVIHRDIKPENILLTADGDTLVADFGIARALAGDDEQLTQTGLSVGTPAYMSPEQASGAKTLDAHTDIYSLATVVHEMLAGEVPFSAPTPQMAVVRRLTEPPPSLRKLRANVPEAVDEAIRRALAPVPADRFASAAEFGAALSSRGATATRDLPAQPPVAAEKIPRSARDDRLRRPVVLALALGFLLGLGVLFAWRRSQGAADDAGTKVLAVLPFENLGDSSDAYFADGVADELRGKLARLEGISVIARNSSDEYRDTRKRPEEIARELGADYLLIARVRWNRSAGGVSRVRVTPELVDVRRGQSARTRWQEPFDAALTDVFQVQAEIAGKVASALDLTLGDTARHRLTAEPTANLAAYDVYLKALEAEQAGSDVPNVRRIIAYLEQAVALDSTFLAAWSRLARNRAWLYGQGTPDPALAAAAREAMERTRALGPDQPETFLALRGYYSNVLRDDARALGAAEAGLARNPGNLDLLNAAAAARVGLGQWEAALAHYRKAAALDPRSAGLARLQTQILLNLRRPAEAAAEADRGRALAPADLFFIHSRAQADLERGDLAAAREVVRQARATVNEAALVAHFALYNELYWVLDSSQQDVLLTLSPRAFDDDRAGWALIRAQVHHLRGRSEPARAYADTAQAAFAAQLERTPDDGQSRALRGLALAYLGRKAEAIAEGERGVELTPVDRYALGGPYVQHQLARIHLLLGEPDRALDRLEAVMRVPYVLTPGWLRIDPTFAPLKGNPRFERLTAGG